MAIHIPGFTENIVNPRKLRVVTCGGKGAGKSRLLATAPDPIGILPLDPNTRGSIAKFKLENPGKTILMPPDDLLIVEGLEKVEILLRSEKFVNKTGNNETGVTITQLTAAEEKRRNEITRLEMLVYRDHLHKLIDLHHKLVSNKDIRTICVDTGTQLNDLVMYATFGKTFQVDQMDYGSKTDPTLAQFWDIVGNKKHYIWTHYWKEEYKKTAGQPKGAATGRYVWRGWRHADYKANVCVSHHKLQTKAELMAMEKELKLDANTLDNPTFAMRVFDSNENPLLVAEGTVLLNDDITFQQLAMLVYPDTGVKDWL